MSEPTEDPRVAIVPLCDRCRTPMERTPHGFLCSHCGWSYDYAHDDAAHPPATMPEEVERVASALYATERDRFPGVLKTWDELSGDLRELWLTRARAAIEAMRGGKLPSTTKAWPPSRSTC